jgi:hypothetical protein
MGPIDDFLARAPVLLLGAIVLLLMGIAAGVGFALRARRAQLDAAIAETEDGDQQGYIVSGVLGLLALLMGFTFSLAVDRFEARRELVLQEANAIGTTYLRTQLLGEPHRARISGMLVAYTDNRIALANASAPDQIRDLLATNDKLLTDLWAATSSAFLTIKGLDFSSSYVESMNNLIDLDAARKAARVVHVPSEAFLVLIVYMTVTAGVLGYVLTGRRGRSAAAFLVALMTLALMLIVDIDHPTGGGVREGQGPMEALRASLKAQPPPVFDRYRIEDARLTPSAP